MNKRDLKNLLNDILSGKGLIPIFMTSGQPPSLIYRTLKGILKGQDSSFIGKVTSKYRVDPQYLLDRIDNILSEIDLFRESNPYSVLGLTYQAKDSEINKRWKELLKTWHPDRIGGDSQALEMTQRINEAYGILGLPESRREYDQRNMPLLAIVRDIEEHIAPTTGGVVSGKRRIKHVAWPILAAAVIIAAGYYFSRWTKAVKETAKVAPSAVSLHVSAKKRLSDLNFKARVLRNPEGVALAGMGIAREAVVSLHLSQSGREERFIAWKAAIQEAERVKGVTFNLENIRRRSTAKKTNPRPVVRKVKRPRPMHAARKKKVYLVDIKMAEMDPGLFPGAAAYVEMDMTDVYNRREVTEQKRTAAKKEVKSGPLDKVIAVTDRYARYYREGNCISLFTLFSVNAVESGVPIKSVWKNYETLFRCLRFVEFHFTKRRITKRDGGYEVDCVYTTRYRKYDQHDICSNRGNISFFVVNAGGSYLISRVMYKRR